MILITYKIIIGIITKNQNPNTITITIYNIQKFYHYIEIYKYLQILQILQKSCALKHHLFTIILA